MLMPPTPMLKPAPLLRAATLLLLASILMALPASLHAQQQGDPPPRRIKNAIALLSVTTPGGVYKIAVRAITAVSTHEYMVEGTRVTELNIDSQGQSQVRFYYLEVLPTEAPHGIAQGLLNRANETIKTVTERTGTDEVWKKVVKSYPTSTHAHTIEYRLAEKGDLMRIFEAANEAFTRQQEVEITVP